MEQTHSSYSEEYELSQNKVNEFVFTIMGMRIRITSDLICCKLNVIQSSCEKEGLGNQLWQNGTDSIHWGVKGQTWNS